MIGEWNPSWKLWILIAGMWIFTACEDESSFVPLPSSMMVEILTEMHVADVVVDKRAGPLAIRRALREELYNEILERFELERQTFLLHYEYYMEHPSLMNDIYQKTAEDLEKKEEQAKKDYAQKIANDKALQEKARKDSIQQAKE